jgi:nitrite reductase/ring-hydroxylating ferredoxin subunit
MTSALKEPLLVPPAATSRPSVVRVDDDWYALCRSEELGKHPLARTLLGAPLVLFRTKDGVGALLDRCPHRNVPLSLGRVTNERLECSYHGWQFDQGGACRHIPCLLGDPDAKARHVASYPAKEQDGHVWVYGRPNVTPSREPYRFPYYDDERYTKVSQQVDLEGSVHAAAENALDVPHTSFLHGGWFRSAKTKHEIEVVIRRWHEGCEAEYIGEPAPKGLLGRLLAPGGGVVTHFDRFLLPSVTQVEYRLGEDSHIVISAAHTPVEDFKTRLFGMAAFRLPAPIPSRVLARLLRPVALIVLLQDAKMLRHQTASIRRFGGEQLVSTDVDVLGPHILRLLKDAEKGKREPREEPYEKRLKMQV